MRKSAYLKRLQSDLKRWTQADWISGALSEKLFADAQGQDYGIARSSPILPGLATLIIVLGLLTVIAANWSQYTGVVRLVLFFGLFGTALIGAGEARMRNLHLVSNLAATIGAALAGGGLVVIGQLYHTGATTSAFLSVWAIFATAIALLLRAPLAAALATLLVIIWTGYHFLDLNLWRTNGQELLFYGPLWAIPIFGSVIYRAVGSRSLGLVHLAFIGLMIWITPTLADWVEMMNLVKSNAFLAMSLIWLVVAIGFEFIARSTLLWATRTVAGWAIWTASSYLVAAAALERFQPVYFGQIGLAIVALAAFSGLAAYGAAPGRRWMRGAGVAGFVAVSLIFFTMADDLLSAGLAMILFGIGLIALLIVTNRMLKHATAQSGEGVRS